MMECGYSFMSSSSQIYYLMSSSSQISRLWEASLDWRTISSTLGNQSSLFSSVFSTSKSIHWRRDSPSHHYIKTAHLFLAAEPFGGIPTIWTTVVLLYRYHLQCTAWPGQSLRRLPCLRDLRKKGRKMITGEKKGKIDIPQAAVKNGLRDPDHGDVGNWDSNMNWSLHILYVQYQHSILAVMPFQSP